MIVDLRVAGQDAQIGVDLGQRAAEETKLARTHPPGIGEQLAHHRAVSPWVEPPGNFEDIPAQRPRSAWVKLADIHSPIQPGPVQRAPPALAKIQHHAAVMPLTGGLEGQPLGCHAFAEAGIPTERRVEMPVNGYAQRSVGQLPCFAAPLPAEDHIPWHTGPEGKVGGGFLHRHGRALLEHPRSGVSRQLEHGQEGRVHVAAHHFRDGFDARRRGKHARVPADIFAFLRRQVARLHPGDHILRAVERLRDQSHQGLLALFGARHGIHVRVVRAFFTGQVEQVLLLAQDLRHQDGRIILPLVAGRSGDRRRNADHQPAGCPSADRLPHRSGLHLAVGGTPGIR